MLFLLLQFEFKNKENRLFSRKKITQTPDGCYNIPQDGGNVHAGRKTDD